MTGGKNMSKWIKVLVLPLLLAIILVPVPLTGCGEKEAEQATPAGSDLHGILGGSIAAMESVNSYTYVLDMTMAMEATGGDSPGKLNTSMESSGAVDLAAKKLKMAFQMHLNEITIPNQPEDMPRDFSAEMYMIEDMFYMKMDLPEIGEQWVKTPLTEQMKEMYNLDIAKTEMPPLEKATDITFVKYETVDGSACYVLKIIPDMAAMKDWFKSHQMTTGAFDFDELDNMQDIFKDLSYTVWISKDDSLMKKMDINMTVELTPSQVDVKETEFDKMTMKIDMEMTMTDFNESVSIVLPEEAENAVEAPGL
jgi:hypothetical protein